MTREQLENQLIEMWDAVSRTSGPDHELAVNEANHIEQKLRLQFEKEERAREAGPVLLEALENILKGRRKGNKDRFYWLEVDIEDDIAAEDAIKKARGL